jgi:hypothetical protein
MSKIPVDLFLLDTFPIDTMSSSRPITFFAKYYIQGSHEKIQKNLNNNIFEAY